MMKLAATGERGVLMCSRRYARLVREHMDRCTKREIKTQVMRSACCIVLTSDSVDLTAVVHQVLAYWCRMWFGEWLAPGRAYAHTEIFYTIWYIYVH